MDVDGLDFLPLGADRNTAVYRATEGQTAYFVKLRWGDFDDITLLVPKLLHDSGVAQVIAPIVSRHGLLATALADFHLLLYPFVEGSDGFECDLSAEQWAEVGRVLRQIHSIPMPAPVLERIPQETFSPYWRERVREFCGLARLTKFDDPVAAALAALLQEKGRRSVCWSTMPSDWPRCCKLEICRLSSAMPTFMPATCTSPRRAIFTWSTGTQ
ncbi:MAG: phosphotransferase [Chloroflexi bacterium]|nr:phosphotransferase [Chloroflexota bacterium]